MEVVANVRSYDVHLVNLYPTLGTDAATSSASRRSLAERWKNTSAIHDDFTDLLGEP